MVRAKNKCRALKVGTQNFVLRTPLTEGGSRQKKLCYLQKFPSASGRVREATGFFRRSATVLSFGVT